METLLHDGSFQEILGAIVHRETDISELDRLYGGSEVLSHHKNGIGMSHLALNGTPDEYICDNESSPFCRKEEPFGARGGWGEGAEGRYRLPQSTLGASQLGHTAHPLVQGVRGKILSGRSGRRLCRRPSLLPLLKCSEEAESL